MKIAIPVNNNTVESGVCDNFGRAPYFLIYDTVSNEKAFLNNKAAGSQGGAGIVAAQALVDSKVDALLTPRCGENAANVLKVAKIEIYKTTGSSVDDNIQSLKDKTLPLLDEIHSGFHNHKEEN